MDLGLYDVDLSLFGGDLIVGLPPTSPELKVTQDAEDITCVPWANTNDLDVSLGRDELADSSNSYIRVVEQPLETSWMDSRVDLLDLLAQEGEHAFVNNASLVSTINDPASPLTPPAADDDAVKLLQDLAEETNQMLAAGGEGDLNACSNNAIELQPAAVAQAAVNNLQSVVVTEDGPTSVDHLLDMLASGMDPGDLGSVVDDPGYLGPMPVVMDSDILTSVSAEDVESILSSGPSSPAAPISLNCDSHSVLPPEQSHSLLAQYLMGSLDTTPSNSASPDVSDMESFTTEVHSSDEDWEYTPPRAYRASKPRSTPYSRSSKASKSKATSTANRNPESRLLDKKMRKKQQNKDAATRYRQKKREEAGLIDSECDILEERNRELKDTVEQMTREIGYLKNLLAEVYKARGLIKPKKLGK